MSEPKTERLVTDKKGRVGLGTLANINRIKVTFDRKNCNETWNIINQERDSWTQSNELNIIEGELVQIPVNFDDSKPFSKAEASLVLNRNNTII